MTKSMIFRSWALGVLAALALGGCNRDWDGSRDIAAGPGSPGMAAAQDAIAMPFSAGAQGLHAGAAAGARPAFASLPDRGDLVGYPGQRIERREGAYTWHRADVSEEHALRAIVDGELRITAPNGQLLAFEYERHVEHPTGDWTWIGRLRDAPPGRQAILTFGARAVFGSIDQALSEPLRLTMRDGASWLVETDPVQLAGVEAQILRPEAPDFLVPPMYFGNPAAPIASGETEASSASRESVESSSSTPTSTTTVVDVLVGFTPGFAIYHGGDSQARTRINFLVDVANQGYINSQIDARVRLVHAMPVNYPDATDNGDTLEKMTGYKSGTGKTTPDPAFSELRNARETYGADLVTLIRKFNTPENDGCGIAWLIGGGLTTITQGYEYFGYSVVGDGIDQGEDGKNYFCREETMVHEFGHNMGSAHDRETAMGDDGILQTKEFGRYEYSFGYRTGPGAGDFYTIMAYREKRESGTQQQPYRVFSNPNITFCGTYACGTSSADNARSLRQTIPIIASFRAIAVPEPAPIRPSLIGANPFDVDGDGRADLLWILADESQLAYWTMNGSVKTGGVGFSVVAPWHVIATGDFNGDGFSDLIWSDGFHMQLWQNTGSGFLGLSMRNYPTGYSVSAVGDLDGDGRTDLVWRHDETGDVGVWQMSGPNIIGSVAYAVPTAWRVLGSGDLSGDGRMDLIWTNESAMQLWVSDGSLGFIGEVAPHYPQGWSLVGVGDVDGDTFDDLLWWHQSTGYIAYWRMMGGQRLQGFGYAPSPPWRPLQLADLTGDGRSDIVFTEGSSMQLWRSNGDGTFAGDFMPQYPAGWELLRR